MISRQRLTVRGIVQGVGFRPFVYRLAQELSLSGWVRNDGAGVSIEAEGDTASLLTLQQRLRQEAPPRAQFDSLQIEEIQPENAANDSFRILESQTDAKGQFDAAIGPDAGICDNCLKELFDPANRRYRYAFINCTDCGPRYTIAKRLPYTREKTSMAGFTQCSNCQSEYDDPVQRRFHAEPNACPVCGPQLNLLDEKGDAIAGDPVTETLKRLQAGEIVAIKGLGGFHLACDARNPDAVARLRERKHREEKPLALMFASPAAIKDYVELSYGEAAQMMVPERPILLLPKRDACDDAFPDVAPGIAWLGVMLPYTPLHYLLFHEAAGRPDGTAWLSEACAHEQNLALVMTSANPHGEPLVKDNDEAVRRLQGIADAFLVHDREIVARCDDTVIRVQPSTQQSQFIRRARGYTPRAIPLSQSGPDVLALGGLYKNTLCLTRREQAFLSPHIGDLSNPATCLALEEAVEHLQHILEVQPKAIAHDKHPDFFSTHLAMRLSEAWQVPAIAVQHHHAHIAAVLAEDRVDEPVLGLALDGVGLGDDGSAWGGELLRVEGAQYERLGHLRQLAMPGGDRAAREPWRMGAAALHLLGRGDEIVERFADQPHAAMLSQLLAGTMRLPMTSSMGRWFDAAAGLLNVQAIMSFEGQAAMRLEGLAASYGKVTPITAHQVQKENDQSVLDLSPLLDRICMAFDAESDAGHGAALFHAGLIVALADWVEQAAKSSGLRIVACGGGCFLNAILAKGLREALQARGLTMLEAQAVPPSDGGLSLGQAWVAREVLQSKMTK